MKKNWLKELYSIFLDMNNFYGIGFWIFSLKEPQNESINNAYLGWLDLTTEQLFGPKYDKPASDILVIGDITKDELLPDAELYLAGMPEDIAFKYSYSQNDHISGNLLGYSVKSISIDNTLNVTNRMIF